MDPEWDAFGCQGEGMGLHCPTSEDQRDEVMHLDPVRHYNRRYANTKNRLHMHQADCLARVPLEPNEDAVPLPSVLSG